MVVIVKIFFLFTLSVYIFTYKLNASEILDYETEIFINTIINDIKKINNINRNIKFKIIANNEINAFVDQNNVVYLTSGLIENCNDYVAITSVLAHEIGHIEKNHIVKRKFEKNKIDNINKLSNLSIVAGSMLASNPEVFKGLSLSNAKLSELIISFSKDQEREADYYSIETLSKLNIYSDSIIELLKKIEKKALAKGLTKDIQKVSSHPYFEERIKLINFLNNNKGKDLDHKLNKDFKFIQAKFIGYSNNTEQLKNLIEPHKSYADSIIIAKNGDLKNSFTILNKLISIDKKNVYLLETKADILYSYGYINESVKFYEQVVNKLPDNLYAQIRFFENANFKDLKYNKREEIFIDNINLLKNYYNNKNILLQYLELAKYLKKNEWIDFLSYWIIKNDSKENILKKLNDFKKTDDKNLIEIIEIIYKNYS